MLGLFPLFLNLFSSSESHRTPQDSLDDSQRRETEERLQDLEAQLKNAQEYDIRVKQEQENSVK